jgi:gas vesicle protein
MIMREESTNRTGSILTSVLVGGTVGAGIALLLAPKSGSETRKDLRRAADRVTHTVDIGKDLYGEGKEFVSKAVEASKKAYVENKPLEIRSSMGRPLMVSILASGIIGAGIGLLLAPKAGKETRAELKQIASDARVKVVSAIDKGKDLYVTGKGAITGAVEAGKKTFVEVKEKIAHAA